MNVYHIAVEMEDGFYCVHALEDSGIHTQGEMLEEALVNVREVIALVRNDKTPQLEVILPAKINLQHTSKRNRKQRIAG